ncbi:MAG: phenylalanine--tRNA ligase beta subunit-related protein [Desulfovibrionaceae bacterium]|nr:phenylalanine--tRNA ligase beta subunit-related protein [Desulfovibrionaceae bacterium]
MIHPAIEIDREIAGLCPGICLGCLFYTASVTEDAAPVWQFYSAEVEPALKKRLAETDLSAMPGIGEARRAFKACGADPGRYRVSSEALYRRVRQGKDLYRISSVVDANNLVSLETGFSLGSYDLGRIEGGILLRRGREGEYYTGIGKGEVPLCSMPLLSDRLGAFGSPVSDSPRSRITAETASVLTVIYGFSGQDAVEKALELAAARLSALAGAAGITKLLVV